MEHLNNIPDHLSFVTVEIHKGIWGNGRVYHNQDSNKTVTVSGVSQDIKGKFYDKGYWFEWTVQLNHPTIIHKWRLLQK